LTDITIQENREDRYGKTERKNLTLTSEVIEAVQAYADRHDLYFSVAIETLTLMGLGNTTAESFPRLVANLLERTFKRQFNRFAKLISTAAISAEEINYKTDVLLLQTIRREAEMDADTFMAKMQVSTDPQDQPDYQVRQIRDDICEDAHDAAVTHLKSQLPHIDALWQEEADDEQ